jgi:AcrR family transcriptional regulator
MDQHVAHKRPRGRPRKTVAERDDGNRRQQLIAGAAKLFRRKGFDATSTRDIAAAKRVCKAARPSITSRARARCCTR